MDKEKKIEQYAKLQPFEGVTLILRLGFFLVCFSFIRKPASAFAIPHPISSDIYVPQKPRTERGFKKNQPIVIDEALALVSEGFGSDEPIASSSQIPKRNRNHFSFFKEVKTVKKDIAFGNYMCSLDADSSTARKVGKREVLKAIKWMRREAKDFPEHMKFVLREEQCLLFAEFCNLGDELDKKQQLEPAIAKGEELIKKTQELDPSFVNPLQETIKEVNKKMKQKFYKKT